MASSSRTAQSNLSETDETFKDAVSSKSTSMTPLTVIESKESETTGKMTEQASMDRSKLPSRLSQASQKLPQLNLTKTPSLPESTIGSNTSSPATVPIASASTCSSRTKSPSFDLKKQLSSGDLTPASESTMATLAIANSASLGALSKSVENLDELPESETPGYEITSSDPSTTFDPTTVVERYKREFSLLFLT